MATMNKAYEAYELMMLGYAQGDPAQSPDHMRNTLFRDGAVRLSASREMAAWSDNDEASILLSTMRNCYYRWKYNGVDRRVNRIRMLKAAMKLANLQLENPFVYDGDQVLDDPDTESLEMLADVEMQLAIDGDIDNNAVAQIAEMTHIMGVLPEKEDE